jgi:hypothetical protein
MGRNTLSTDKHTNLPEFISKVPQRWLMLVLLILDIVTLIGILYLNFSQLLKKDPLIFWFIIAFIVLTSTLVMFSYFAFRDVAKERDKYKSDKENLEKDLKKSQNIPAAIISSGGGKIKIGGTADIHIKGTANGLRATSEGTIEAGELKVNKEEQKDDELNHA